MAALFGGNVKFDNVLASALKVYNIAKLQRQARCFSGVFRRIWEKPCISGTTKTLQRWI